MLTQYTRNYFLEQNQRGADKNIPLKKLYFFILLKNTFFLGLIQESTKFLKFVGVEIEKMKFHSSEESIKTYKVNFGKTLISSEFTNGKNKEADEEYFIRYRNDNYDEIRPLVVKFPQIRWYSNEFKGTKYMFLLTEDKPLLRKKIIGLGYDQEHDLITILVIKKEILKNKIKSYGIKITADLYTNKEKNTQNRFSLFLFARSSTRFRVYIVWKIMMMIDFTCIYLFETMQEKKTKRIKGKIVITNNYDESDENDY